MMTETQREIDHRLRDLFIMVTPSRNGGSSHYEADMREAFDRGREIYRNSIGKVLEQHKPKQA